MLRATFIVFTLLTMFLAAPHLVAADEPWVLEAPVTMEDVERIIAAPHVQCARKTTEGERYLLDFGRAANKKTLQALLDALSSSDGLTEGACDGQTVQQVLMEPYYFFVPPYELRLSYDASQKSMHNILLSLQQFNKSLRLSVFISRWRETKSYCLQPTTATMTTLQQGLTATDTDKWLLDPPITLEKTLRVIENHTICVRCGTTKGNTYNIDVTSAYGAKILQALLTTTLNIESMLRHLLEYGVERSIRNDWYYEASFDPPLQWQLDGFRDMTTLLLPINGLHANDRLMFMYIDGNVYATPLPLPDILYREPAE